VHRHLVKPAEQTTESVVQADEKNAPDGNTEEK